MKIPTIHGYIDRRILINFTTDPIIIQKILPPHFKPQIYKEKAVVGICLIRLKNIKPKGLPDFIGVSSENGAHRIAVEWNEGENVKHGVYIPRRDTSSKLNSLVGGRLFPGKHYYAKFNVKETETDFHVDFLSSDQTKISIDAVRTNTFNKNSIFKSLEEASNFFQKGEVGFSPNKNKLEGLKLQTYKWEIEPLEVSNVHSSFFENSKLFPKGCVEFDNALLMRKIEHEWHSASKIIATSNKV